MTIPYRRGSHLHPDETYVFVDVEADGPVPGLHSMLSMAAVAYDWKGNEISTFYRKLEPLPNAEPHPLTEEWWSRQTDMAYREARSNARPAKEVIFAFKKWWEVWMKEDDPWLRKARWKRPVFVANPTHFDAAWLRYYTWRFLDMDVFGDGFTRCIDMHSMAIGRYGGGHRTVRFPVDGDGEKPHHALEDARLQAETFFELAAGNPMEEWEGMEIATPISILQLVVAEWESDPMSVQCFDLQIVDKAKRLVNEYRSLEKIRQARRRARQPDG